MIRGRNETSVGSFLVGAAADWEGEAEGMGCDDGGDNSLPHYLTD